MNLQAEKIELIKLIVDIKNESIINKIKDVLSSGKNELKIEYPQEHILTRSGMLVSERILNEAWKDERDDEWNQYLKD